MFSSLFQSTLRLYSSIAPATTVTRPNTAAPESVRGAEAVLIEEGRGLRELMPLDWAAVIVATTVTTLTGVEDAAAGVVTGAAVEVTVTGAGAGATVEVRLAPASRSAGHRAGIRHARGGCCARDGRRRGRDGSTAERVDRKWASGGDNVGRVDRRDHFDQLDSVSRIAREVGPT